MTGDCHVRNLREPGAEMPRATRPLLPAGFLLGWSRLTVFPTSWRVAGRLFFDPARRRTTIGHTVVLPLVRHPCRRVWQAAIGGWIVTRFR